VGPGASVDVVAKIRIPVPARNQILVVSPWSVSILIEQTQINE